MLKSSPKWHFDSKYWLSRVKDPDWYIELVPYIKETEKSLRGDEDQVGEFRFEIRRFFETALMDGKVYLAKEGPNLDEQREPIDTIVIHHTSNRPGYRVTYMNAVQLLNIYAPYFTNPTIREERNLQGTAVWSGHFKDGKPSFLAYHWLMRMDGSFERLLSDEQLGWHAGNWDINCRSVGICLDSDYEKMCPADSLLLNLADHIKKHYPKIKASHIMGHCECRKGTNCPGDHFLTEWKSKLIENLV